MKRQAKIHLYQNKGNRARCGALVPAGQLTGIVKAVTCNKCKGLVESDLGGL